MRIISGRFAKRNLFTLNSKLTRPTSDKVKEALFNSLGQYFAEGRVLDLYGGSGALAIEAVSRGCEYAVITDINRAAVDVIKKNVALTKHEEKFSVYKMSSKSALKLLAHKEEKFDLVFLDPPYAKQKIVEDMLKLSELKLLNHGARVVAETDSYTNLGEIPGFSMLKEHQIGKTIVRFFSEG